MILQYFNVTAKKSFNILRDQKAMITVIINQTLLSALDDLWYRYQYFKGENKIAFTIYLFQRENLFQLQIKFNFLVRIKIKLIANQVMIKSTLCIVFYQILKQSKTQRTSCQQSFNKGDFALTVGKKLIKSAKDAGNLQSEK